MSDCRSENGITIGLIDSIISISRVLKGRLTNNYEVVEALKDLNSDSDLKEILNYANEASKLQCSSGGSIA